MQFAYAAGIVVVLLLILGWAYEKFARAKTLKNYPPPGTIVKLNTHALHIHPMGHTKPGQPVVVLEAGLGSGSFDWRKVQPSISEFARVISYDRAGMGFSQPAKKQPTPQTVAADLHQLLQNANEPGPYLLVGHSLGGVFIRQFAALYPHDTAGLIFIDSAHENQLQKLPPEDRQSFKSSLPLYKILSLVGRFGFVRMLARTLILPRFPSVTTPAEENILLSIVSRYEYYAAIYAESKAFMEFSTSSSGPLSLGQLPITVIQAGAKPDPLPAGFSEDQWSQLRSVFTQIQQELSRLSANSRYQIAENSIHAVPVEEPDVVVGAVKEILSRISA